MDSLTANLSDLSLANRPLPNLPSSDPQSPIRMQDQDQSRLFSLPAELRNTIYTNVLTLTPGALSIDLSLRDPLPSLIRQEDTVILCTCKRIHSETQKLFYALNTLHIIAPAFTRESWDGTRLKRLSTSHPGLKNLQRVEVHMGKTTSLMRLKWMEFFCGIHDVGESLRQLQEKIDEGGEVRVELHINRGGGARAVRVEFGIKDKDEVKRAFEPGTGTAWDDWERKKVGKMGRTVVKVLFPA